VTGKSGEALSFIPSGLARVPAGLSLSVRAATRRPPRSSFGLRIADVSNLSGDEACRRAEPLLTFIVRKPLSQTPGLNEAEEVFVAGEPAIGGDFVLFEGRSLAASLARSRVRSQRH
jgi:hypothetical protein